MQAHNFNALQFGKNGKDKRNACCEILSVAICLVAGIALIEVYFQDGIWNSIQKSGQHLTVEHSQQVYSSTIISTLPNNLFFTINSYLSFQQHLFIIKRLLQNNEDSTDSGSIAKSVLIIIIVVFIVLPFASLVIFSLIVLYRRCQNHQQRSQAFQTPAQLNINIDNYKIDEIGPYLSNPNDQCSICLDKEVNIRTFCAHFFHGQCLKAWYDKKTTDGRSMTCPVCVGTQINPVKIYCKKCYVSGKLDVIYYETPSQKIQEFSNFVCNQCKVSEQVRSEVTRKDSKKQQHETNDSNGVGMYSANKLYIVGFI